MFRRIKNRLFRYILIILCVFILLLSAIQINFLGLFGYSPTHNDIVSVPVLNMASELYTADSVLIARYFREDRDLVEFDSISKTIIDALIATEDIRFYQHHGIDIIGLFSSAFSTLKGDFRGGSTISQQLAKNLYKTRYEQSQGLLGKISGISLLVTKLKEWMTAFKLEQQYSKNEILTMYLNTVSFSNNAYGINSASQRYFNKKASDIDVTEAAMLIGMLKGTTYYNPIRNPENALRRRNVVLGQMNKVEFLSDQEFEILKNKPLGLDLTHYGNTTHNSYIRSAVERWLEDWSEENNVDIYTAGLRIYTTIDSRMQKIAEDSMSEQMEILQKRLDDSWRNELPWRNKSGEVIADFLESHARKLPAYESLMKKFGDEELVFEQMNTPKEMEIFTWDGGEKVNYSTMDSLRHYLTMLNTGIMAMDPYEGDIKIWVGGIQNQYYKYDHVDQSKRQAGSTFKPFVYLTALESGMSPCDQVVDKPISIEFVNDKGEKETWRPRNADWTVSNSGMSLRWAMARSLNTVTAQLTQKVGWDKVVETAHRLGIESHLAAVPSVGLGSNDVSLYEMVRSYATFINGGKNIKPRLVTEIRNHEDQLIVAFNVESKQVIDKENAWLMSYMLKGTIEEPGGTSQALWGWDLFRNKNEVGGKTGTSSDYVDGWYIGFTKDLVTGVWVGCDEQSIHFKNSQTGEGSKTALPIFGQIMERIYKLPELGYTLGEFPPPTIEITKRYKCPNSQIIKEDMSDSSNLEIDTPSIPKLLLPEVFTLDNKTNSKSKVDSLQN